MVTRLEEGVDLEAVGAGMRAETERKYGSTFAQWTVGQMAFIESEQRYGSTLTKWLEANCPRLEQEVIL